MEATPDAEEHIPISTVDPKGDVVLELDGERLLVSSKVLILVSPVFGAMFKPS